MSHKRKGQLIVGDDWVQHYRPIGRRIFWSRERMAEHTYLANQLKEFFINSNYPATIEEELCDFSLMDIWTEDLK